MGHHPLEVTDLYHKMSAYEEASSSRSQTGLEDFLESFWVRGSELI